MYLTIEFDIHIYTFLFLASETIFLYSDEVISKQEKDYSFGLFAFAFNFSSRNHYYLGSINRTKTSSRTEIFDAQQNYG